MRFLKFDLTIFQKMLVAPILGMVLYSAYLLFINGEHEQGSQSMSNIRQDYLPALELATRNVILFEVIATNMKDAVLAREKDWVLNTRKEKKEIFLNLERIKNQLNSIQLEHDIEQLKFQFGHYYDNAFSLSLTMLKSPQNATLPNQLIENVEKYHRQTQQGLESLKKQLQDRFSMAIDDINHRLDRLVFIGIVAGIILILMMVALTFAMSLSTRHSLARMNRALKNMAQKKPDFSKRLKRHSDDELGEMVTWFNQLSDKLESDYKKIEQLSITDKLTQLYNRTKIDELFQLELSKTRRYEEPLTIVLIDLDHFKQVNDQYGHLVGDQVLQHLSLILKDNVRSTDHLGRWGGEEFIIICPNTNLEQALYSAEKLRNVIAETDFPEVGTKTASFGVASINKDDNEDSVTKRADDCLYMAKEKGRNIVINETMLSDSPK